MQYASSEIAHQYIVVTQALVTNLPTRIDPLAGWRDYNQRAQLLRNYVSTASLRLNHSLLNFPGLQFGQRPAQFRKTKFKPCLH